MKLQSLITLKSDKKRELSIILRHEIEEEPELRPEFIEKIRRRERQKSVKYNF